MLTLALFVASFAALVATAWVTYRRSGDADVATFLVVAFSGASVHFLAQLV